MDRTTANATEFATAEQAQALAVTTDDLIRQWLEHEQQEGASSYTLKAYRKGINVFTAWLLGTGAAAGTVTPQTIQASKADLARDYSPQTVNLHDPNRHRRARETRPPPQGQPA